MGKPKAHRGKKRQSKTTKSKTKVPWGKLISQCSEVGFSSLPHSVRDKLCLVLSNSFCFLLKWFGSERQRKIYLDVFWFIFPVMSSVWVLVHDFLSSLSVI